MKKGILFFLSLVWPAILISSALIGLPLIGLTAAQPPTGTTLDRSLTGKDLAKPAAQRWQFGLTVDAKGGSCSGIVATLPVPMDWPDQKVSIVAEDISTHVSRVSYKTLDGGVRVMTVSIPRLRAGQVATAIVTFEVVKRSLAAPSNPEGFVLPNRLPRELVKYLRPSPMIESTHSKIKSLAKEIVAGKESDWEKVETIYDWVRENIEYRFDVQLRGALAALKEGHGDCEELTSLFIALCRANKIPARSIWVPGHCYPEFYLQDSQNVGRWFPCQAAGNRQLGTISELRPILQKGDSFRVAGKRKPQRYVAPTLKAQNVTATPEIRWVQQMVEADAKLPGS